jgi:prevent-host-death family protein
MPKQSVSHVEAHLAEVIENVRESHDHMVITQNGANTAVIQDYESHQRTRQYLAVLKLIAMGEKDIAKGRIVSQAEVFRSLKQRLQTKIERQAKSKSSRSD